MKTNNTNTAHDTCRWLAQMLADGGARWAVCCPGSRNTPLLMAFAREERLRKVVVVDERSAGYIAIGIAQQTQQPVAVVCTSGTALLNLAPAAAEAYYAHVPLIVVSADRPSQWIDQNDSQTIRQPLALEQATKWHTSLPSLPSSDDERWHTQRMLNEAWQMATKLPLGTIHINIHISEPIAQTASIEQNDWRSIFHPCTKPRIVAHQATMLAERFASMRRVMVVCGMMPPNAELNSLLCQMANRSNCVVLAEPVSNIHGNGIITEPERALCALTADQEHQLAPELVIYLGGALVSRRMKEYLRSHPCEQWRVGVDHNIIDTFMHLACNITAEPEELFSALAAAKPIASDYSQRWADVAESAQTHHQQSLADAPWCSLAAVDAVCKQMPEGTILHLSNGLSVRLASICGAKQACQWWSNRGTSGIDGSTSTALGASLAAPDGKTVLLITGDMSLNYDLSALNTHLDYSRLKIVVMCNGGGGIFRFISTTGNLPELEEYMEVRQQTPVGDFARTFGFNYYVAENSTQLNDVLPKFFADKQPAILAIFTDSATDAQVLQTYYNRNK